MSAPAADTPTVFVSYSHADEDWLDAFRVWLAPVIRKRRVELWADDYIRFGDVWRREIDTALERASLALLLVSPAFLNSTFILEQELPRLAQRGVRFAAVLVHECLWEEEPLLERVQFVYGAREGPLAVPGTAVKDRSRELAEICRRIVAHLPDVAPEGTGAPEPPAAAAGVRELVATEALGRLDGVPERPPAFVDREELAALRAHLLGGSDMAVGLTGNPQALGLHGDGGIGKSVLAAELARDAGVRRAFPEGVFWLTLGERPDLVGAQVDLLSRLGVPHPEVSTVPDGLSALRDALTSRQCLLIVDDVWSAHAAQAFLVTGAEGRVLYTARDPIALETVGARVEHVDVLPEAAARRLLATLAGVEPAALPPAADEILAATQRVAFSVALVGAAAGRGGRSWEEVAEELARAGGTYLDHPYADAFKAMQVGISALDRELLASYTALAVYPEDTVIPTASVERLWARLHGLTGAQTAARLQALAERKLLVAGTDDFRFHDLQRQFLLLQAGADASVFHGELLAAYRDLLGGSRHWSQLPPDEPYIWAHVMYHLYGARDRAEMASLAVDLGFLARRAFYSGRNAAERDLERAAALHPEQEAVQWTARFLRQWGHLLVGHDSLGELAATVASRLDGLTAGVDTSGLNELLPPRYLRPLRPLPHVPAAVNRVLEPNVGILARLAFSPDGAWLAGGEREPVIWNVRTGEVVHRPELPAGVSSVDIFCFSPNRRYLAGISTDPAAPSNFHETTHVVFAWDLHTTEPARVLTRGEIWEDTDPVVAWAPDTDRLAAAVGQSVTLWDAPAWRPAATFREEDEVSDLALAPGGRLLALVTAGGGRLREVEGTGVRRLQLRRGRLRFRSSAVHIQALAFDADGQLWTVAWSTVRCFDPISGQCRSTRELAASLVNPAFSPDGRRLLGWNASAPVTVDLDSGELTRARVAPKNSFRTVVSPCGRLLAEGADDGYVRLWDLAESAPAPLADGQQRTQSRTAAFASSAPIYARVYHELEDRAARGARRTWSARVELCDVSTGAPAGAASLDEGRLTAIALAADARRVAFASEDAVGVAEISAPPRLIVRRETGPVDPYGRRPHILDVSVSSDGERVAWETEGAIHVLDADGQHWSHSEDDLPHLHGVVLAPDGRHVAYTFWKENDGTWWAGLWEPGGNRADRMPWPDSSGFDVLFSADGRQLLGHHYQRLVLWDVDGLALRHDVAADIRSRSVALSPDGRLLAGVGGIELDVWELATGARIAGLKLGFTVEDVHWGAWGIGVGGPDGTACLELA